MTTSIVSSTSPRPPTASALIGSRLDTKSAFRMGSHSMASRLNSPTLGAVQFVACTLAAASNARCAGGHRTALSWCMQLTTNRTWAGADRPLIRYHRRVNARGQRGPSAASAKRLLTADG